MNKIFKYPLEVVGKQTIKLPIKSKILTIKEQNGELFLWAVIDEQLIEEKENEKRKIRILGTGHTFDDTFLHYIDTVKQLDGKLIWHVFEDVSK